MPSPLTVWLRRGVVGTLRLEASERYPLETGGILMGYWADRATAVVTEAIGPGPNAVHEPHAFTPDHGWQAAEVARRYRRSDRAETYLGDWHSHPDEARPHLSRRDRATLYRIAAEPAARAPMPIMAVLHGNPSRWESVAWIGRVVRTMLVFHGLRLTQAQVRIEAPS
jgi:integrative and conjugative element protein (TIGR02256 family)